MALIQCPECQRQVSDAAHNCPNCGFPIASRLGNVQVAAQPTYQPPAPVEAETPDKPATWLCSKCGARGGYRRFELLHREGTTFFDAKSGPDISGLGGTGLGVGFGTSRTQGVGQTELAASVAPPNEIGFTKVSDSLSYLGVAGLCVAAAGFFMFALFNVWDAAIWMMFLGGLAFFVPIAANHEKYKRQTFPHLLAEWRRSYMCTACGDVRVA